MATQLGSAKCRNSARRVSPSINESRVRKDPEAKQNKTNLDAPDILPFSALLDMLGKSQQNLFGSSTILAFVQYIHHNYDRDV